MFTVRLLKLVRVRDWFSHSARELITRQYARFHFGIVPVLRLAVWALITVHAMCVAWMAISPPGWRYIDAAYVIMYTLTTTGYGDVDPETDGQKAFLIFLFCCATIVTGLV
eukprot:gene15578-16838_t